MTGAHFPWQPLGTLLVQQGVLSSGQLDLALAEQRRSGRLLGQILVDSGYLTGLSLARALSEQHGVELRPKSQPAPSHEIDPGRVTPSAASEASPPWRPLGRLLVEKGYLTELELEEALAQQLRREGSRLGEILVEGDYVSGPELARALAEQHGVELAEPGVELETVIRPPTPDEPVYQVCNVVLEPSYLMKAVLSESHNFLEAADFAFEYLDENEPEALEIQRVDGETRETVWMYSEARAAAESAAKSNLVTTFGFDPTRWDAGSQLR
jgi:hypothetical protein